MNTQDLAKPSQDSRNLALLTWVGTLFMWFLPSLIMYLVKKDDAYVHSQAKEALNWSITVLIGYVAGAILSLILIGALVIIAVGMGHLVICILGAVRASEGVAFRAPFTIRLIK